jgi:nicotinamidase/pyrazinamidase
MTGPIPVTDPRVLIIVDPLKRFTATGAPFEVPDAAPIIERTNVAIAACREQGIPVIWTTRLIRPTVGMGTRTGQKYGTIPDAFLGRWAEIDDRLDVRPEDIVIDKTRHSAFYQTDLEGILRTWGTREVLLAGFTINVCMLATAFDAVARDLRVKLLEDLSGALGTTWRGEVVDGESIHRMTSLLIEYAVGTVSTSVAELGLEKAPIGSPAG